MAQNIHYIYRWNRIIGAMTVLVFLVCLVSYGVYSLVETESPMESPDTTRLALNNEVATKYQSLPQSGVDPSARTEGIVLPGSPDVPVEDNSQQRSNKSPIESAPLPLGVSEKERLPAIAIESDPLSVDINTNLPHEQQATGASETKKDQPFLSDKEPPGQQADFDPAAPQPEQSESDRADFPQNSGTGKTFQLQEINSISSSVKRFILARTIIDREPIGSIDSITTDTNGVAAIYAFSEVTDMSGRTLYYHWYINEEQVAKVRVNVGTDSWRSYSSKYIDKNMKGAWLVELRTRDGQELARAKFFAVTH